MSFPPVKGECVCQVYSQTLAEEHGRRLYDYVFTVFFQVAVPWGNGGDISGSVVTCDKPAFVTSGAVMSSVGILQWMDTLVATLPPVERLGTHYIIGAARARTSGDAIKITGMV
jgi:hypothetical protein